MKAIELIQKYETKLVSRIYEDKVEAAKNIINDLSIEAGSLIKSRKAVKDSSLISILKEQNDKWNAIVRKMEDCPLKRDAFKEIWLYKMPELKLIWH